MGYLRIIRPVNCLITSFSVCVGAWIGNETFLSPALILAALIGFVVCAFGNLVNDLMDIRIDTINNPNRPLVKKTVSKTVVIALAIYFFICAFIFSLSLGIAPFIIVFGTLIMLFVYAWVLKKTLAANVVVSVLTGLSFVLGGVIAENLYCIFPFLFSFFIHMAREIIKDIIDIEGDKRFGVRSLSISFGNKRACKLSALCLVILCVILPIPFISGTLGFWYMVLVVLGALPLLVYTILKLLQCPPAADLIRLSRSIKIIMAIGLLAMIL